MSRALITGASSGIGAAFARKLSARGYDLVLVARRKDRLEQLARELGKSEVLVADLSRAEDLERVEERIKSATDLDLLVNNAGFGTKGRFMDRGVDEQERMHRVHVIATMRLTHAALDGMKSRGRGSIINVSSVGAFSATPSSISYCATKAWMNMFTTGLHIELRAARSPVRVQALCPGLTRTEFHDVMGINVEKLPAFVWRSADYVVDASLDGLDRGKLIVIPGWGNRLLASFMQWTPPFLLNRMSIAFGRRMAGR